MVVCETGAQAPSDPQRHEDMPQVRAAFRVISWSKARCTAFNSFFAIADNATVRRKTSDFPCLGGNALGKDEVLQDRGHKLVGSKDAQV